MLKHGYYGPLVQALLATVLLSFVLSGCTSNPLPSGHKRSFTAWTNFGQAKKAYDRVVIGKTTFRDLKELGFDPFVTPNVKRLTYLDVINFFMPNPSITMEQLSSGLQQCINAKSKCYGIEAWPRVKKKRRYGNTALDLMNFEKKTEVSGWDFRAIVVLVNNRVVFKIWSGTPNILEYSDEKNPLGPIQGASDYLLD